MLFKVQPPKSTPRSSVEGWEIAAAPWGSGAVLVFVGGAERCVWAPPGVPLQPGREPVAFWRLAEVSPRGSSPRAGIADWSCRMTVCQALERLPAAFRAWVMEQTEEQIAALETFASLDIDGDPLTESALLSAEQLRAELDEATATAGASKHDTRDERRLELQKTFYVLISNSSAREPAKIDIPTGIVHTSRWLRKAHAEASPTDVYVQYFTKKPAWPSAQPIDSAAAAVMRSAKAPYDERAIGMSDRGCEQFRSLTQELLYVARAAAAHANSPSHRPTDEALCELTDWLAREDPASLEPHPTKPVTVANANTVRWSQIRQFRRFFLIKEPGDAGLDIKPGLRRVGAIDLVLVSRRRYFAHGICPHCESAVGRLHNPALRKLAAAVLSDIHLHATKANDTPLRRSTGSAAELGDGLHSLGDGLHSLGDGLHSLGDGLHSLGDGSHPPGDDRRSDGDGPHPCSDSRSPNAPRSTSSPEEYDRQDAFAPWTM